MKKPWSNLSLIPDLHIRHGLTPALSHQKTLSKRTAADFSIIQKSVWTQKTLCCRILKTSSCPVCSSKIITLQETEWWLPYSSLRLPSSNSIAEKNWELHLLDKSGPALKRYRISALIGNFLKNIDSKHKRSCRAKIWLSKLCPLLKYSDNIKRYWNNMKLQT